MKLFALKFSEGIKMLPKQNLLVFPRNVISVFHCANITCPKTVRKVKG